MSGLFGRGGGSDEPPENKYDSPFSAPTEPTPLDLKDLKNRPVKKTNTSSGNFGGGYSGGGFGGGGYYEGRGGSGRSGGSDNYRRHRENPESDFSDISEVDNLSDEELRNLRKDNYKLSNEERYSDIRHKNDFNNIAKIIVIAFAVIVGLGFMVVIGIIAYTSVKAGHVTEAGVGGSILNFIVDLIKIIMS